MTGILPVTFGYYTYWHGCPVTAVHALLEPGRFFGAFPVGGGLVLAFVQGPRDEYLTFRRDPLTAYVSELRSRPALALLLADAVIAERLRGTAALPTFFRTPGPGWALAGDVDHYKDPLDRAGDRRRVPRRGPGGLGRRLRLGRRSGRGAGRLMGVSATNAPSR